jgi:hypothetical protein
LNFLTNDKTLLIVSFVLMLLGVVTCMTKTHHDAAVCIPIVIGCLVLSIWAWRNKGDLLMRGASAFNFFACAGFYWFHR